MDYHFKYSLTEDEFAEFNAYTAWHAPWLRKVRYNFILRTTIYAAISMVATFFILDKLRSTPAKNNTLPLIIISLILLAIVALISFYQEPFNIRRRARKLILKEENLHILNETELEINDEGVISSDKEGRGQQKWTAVIRYAVTKDSFYLYTNSMQAYIIPKRLFCTQKEIEEFDKFLTSKVSLTSSFRSMGI